MSSKMKTVILVMLFVSLFLTLGHTNFYIHKSLDGVTQAGDSYVTVGSKIIFTGRFTNPPDGGGTIDTGTNKSSFQIVPLSGDWQITSIDSHTIEISEAGGDNISGYVVLGDVAEGEL